MIRVRDGEEERLFTLEEFEKRARLGEVSPHAWVCMPAMTGERFVQARELPLFVSIYDPRRVHFRRHFQIGRLPLLTGALVLLCALLFLLTLKLGEDGQRRDAILMLIGAKAQARIIEDGDLWRLLVANFLHMDAVHLAFNLFALVNVGTMLEGVYRRGDYLLLLVISGVVAMTVSLLLSGVATVGASGMIFGCLGCAVVFGWRYSDVLPSRYRNYFGVVLVAYAAAMFYLGLRTPSTDNWSHAGGLMAGVVMGLFLEPRLLRLTEAKEPWRHVVTPWALSCLVGIVLLAAGPAVPKLFFRLEPYRVEAFGVELVRPAHWTKVAEPLGILVFGNGVDAFASLGCTGRSNQKSYVDDWVRRYIDGELYGLVHSGSIGRLEVSPTRETVIGGPAEVEARSFDVSFVASDGPRRAEAVLFSRGQLECALVLGRTPTAQSGSLDRLREIRDNLRIVDTRAEVAAAAALAKDPDDAQAWLELGLAKKTAGKVDAARRAFERGSEQAREGSRLAVQLAFARAHFELEHAVDFDAAARALEGIEPDAEGHELELAVLRIDIAARSGQLAQARTLLDAAEVRFGKKPELIERLRALDAVQFPGPR